MSRTHFQRCMVCQSKHHDVMESLSLFVFTIHDYSRKSHCPFSWQEILMLKSFHTVKVLRQRLLVWCKNRREKRIQVYGTTDFQITDEWVICSFLTIWFHWLCCRLFPQLQLLHYKTAIIIVGQAAPSSSTVCWWCCFYSIYTAHLRSDDIIILATILKDKNEYRSDRLPEIEFTFAQRGIFFRIVCFFPWWLLMVCRSLLWSIVSFCSYIHDSVIFSFEKRIKWIQLLSCMKLHKIHKRVHV